MSNNIEKLMKEVECLKKNFDLKKQEEQSIKDNIQVII